MQSKVPPVLNSGKLAANAGNGVAQCVSFMLRRERGCATVKKAKSQETHAMTKSSPEIKPVPGTDLDNRIMGCLPGAFPWDDWQREALASGLDAELASLGRAVMREAYQHDWCDRLKYECGIDNAATAAGMTSCAKDQPHVVEARWQWLLATDGLRVDPWEHHGTTRGFSRVE